MTVLSAVVLLGCLALSLGGMCLGIWLFIGLWGREVDRIVAVANGVPIRSSSQPEYLDAEQITEALMEQFSVPSEPPTMRVPFDPTEMSVPDPSRPKVIRIEPGDSLIPDGGGVDV